MNMKRTILMIALVASVGILAYWLGQQSDTRPAEASGTKEREVLYWVAPMDPNFRRDQPGKSPMGMDLVPVYADESAIDNAVYINPVLENNLGVRTAMATVRPLWRRIEATGYVGLDETRISHINLRTEGWIERLAVNAQGERVSRGDLLFEYYSPQLVNAQKEFLQVIQRKDDRLATGAEEKLRALGMNPSEIQALRREGRASELIKVFAPRDGIVTELNVREGMHVQPNTTIMGLADLGSVWIIAEVFESQAEWVAAGQAAEAWLDYIPGSVFVGNVDYVYPVLDADTRTLRVRLRFDNAGEKLKPNMYARVSIFGRLRPSALTIPREALIRGQERNRVVISLGNGGFRVHEVLAGMESGEWVEIVAGIEEGDEVVTSAQFLIDSEASLAGSILRLGSAPNIESDTSPVTAFGSGWIEEIKIDEGRMRISHGPIDALGWPAMNMELEVEPGIDLRSFKVGQDIRFQLRQGDSGRFVISSASLPDVEATDEETAPAVSGHEGHDHD